jgi:FkbM family methyltransferase
MTLAGEPDGPTGMVSRAARGALIGVARRLGLDVHRRNPRAMRRTLEEALAHLSNMGFQPATVIDVGVGYGTEKLYAAFPEASHVLIEPLAEFRETLEDICRRYSARYVLAAAGSSAGTKVINVHPYLEGSSTLHEQGRPDGIVPREVPVVTVDDVCRNLGLSGPYLIKVDVQGGELEVLAGAAETLLQTDVVVLEVSLFQFVESGPELHDVIAAMKDRGFVAYDLFGGHTRPLDDALGQLDVSFVQERGRFRQSHRYGQA